MDTSAGNGPNINPSKHAQAASQAGKAAADKEQKAKKNRNDTEKQNKELNGIEKSRKDPILSREAEEGVKAMKLGQIKRAQQKQADKTELTKAQLHQIIAKAIENPVLNPKVMEGLKSAKTSQKEFAPAYEEDDDLQAIFGDQAGEVAEAIVQAFGRN